MLTVGTDSIAITTYPIPPVTIMVGNPVLVEVKAAGFFDLTQNYHLNVHVAGKFFQKVSIFNHYYYKTIY